MEYSASGLIVGNGAAINISLGWYPDFVWVSNLTDGDIITTATLSRQFIAFTSGGTNEVVAGDTIVGATSGSRAVVEAVLLSSGTWAAGSAAGFFVIEEQTGTFTTEAVYVDGDGTTDDASVVAVATTTNVAIAAAAASATSNAAISRYVGSATAGKGFTIGSTIAEEAKALHWWAIRGTQRKYGQ